MSEIWINFLVLLSIQFLIFILFAYRVKRLKEIPRILSLSIIIGLFVGLFLDYGLGKILGLHTYTLGLSLPFIVINGALSYGLYAATVLLMQSFRLHTMIAATMIVTFLYEITNLLFPVWIWKFNFILGLQIMILVTGYICGAVLISSIWHTLCKYRFEYIRSIFK